METVANNNVFLGPAKDSKGSVVWTYFGILTQVKVSERYVILFNEKEERAIMSRKAYKQMADKKAEKAQALIGKAIKMRTSNGWSATKWFSDVEQTVVTK